MTLQDIIKKKILILDGAMGTMIQSYNLTESDFRGERFKDVPGIMKGNNDVLNLTRPDIIREIHQKYLAAGADIIETNTFSSQPISMSDYHIAEYSNEITKAGCKIAREIADEFTAIDPTKPRFVAGSIGPTNKACSISPDINNPAVRDISFDEMVHAYKLQMTEMLLCDVDAFLIETIFDTLNAKAAIYAAEEAMNSIGKRIPLMLSATIADTGGRTLSGQTLDAFVTSVKHADIFSIGLNCSFGAKQLKPFIKQLAQTTPYYISVHPNAGLPNSFGQYDQTPEEMADEMDEYLKDSLVNIIGGCCGTTENFIKKLSSLADNYNKQTTPHSPYKHKYRLKLSGLETLEINPHTTFINIGERCNVAGSRKFLRLIKEKKYDEALSIARKQVENGAMVLDINMDDGLIDTTYEMTNFLNLIMSDPDISKVPIMIDSSKWETIVSGLKCIQGRSIVNSISLKEGEDIFIKQAKEIKRLGASVVVMAFDEEGQATSFERKTAICLRAYNILVYTVGYNPNDIIFDPNVLTIATGVEEHNNYALDFIRATEWIKTNLKGCHVTGGISNLSFSFRGNNYIREAMHAVFLFHAIQHGLDMAILNPAAKVLYNDIPDDLLNAIEDLIFNRTDNATERVTLLANQLKGEGETNDQTESDKWRNENDVNLRLEHAIIKGISDYLEEDINEALKQHQNPLSIIEGPLMSAMNQIGDLFGTGKMFLPQVVKSARTMKKTVSWLQPLIESQYSQSKKKKGKILLATVKGDVHDIGKNIVSVILSCNNYEIIDLGVMVPAEEIVKTALKEKVDIIGLSGLITPSLYEMINVAQLLEKANANIPLMIGGATTSELHTAIKIAPSYSAPTIWMKDASQNVIVASQLLNQSTKETFEESHRKKQEELAKAGICSGENNLSIKKARKKSPNLF